MTHDPSGQGTTAGKLNDRFVDSKRIEITQEDLGIGVHMCKGCGIILGSTKDDVNKLIAEHKDKCPNYFRYHINHGVQVTLYPEDIKRLNEKIWEMEDKIESLEYNCRQLNAKLDERKD